MTTSDPSRSPAGTESFWAYTHVPQPAATRSDAGGEISGRVGPRRPRAVRRPHAGAHRGARTRLRLAGRCPAGARAPRARGPQRQPHRRRRQRRHLPAPPGAGLPPGARDARARGDRRRRASTSARHRPTPAEASTAPPAPTRPAPRCGTTGSAPARPERRRDDRPDRLRAPVDRATTSRVLRAARVDDRAVGVGSRDRRPRTRRHRSSSSAPAQGTSGCWPQRPRDVGCCASTRTRSPCDYARANALAAGIAERVEVREGRLEDRVA